MDFSTIMVWRALTASWWRRTREHYAFQMPYVLLPDMAASPVTDPLMEGSYYPILPISQGLTVSGGNSRGTVSALLTTSESSFSKAAG